VEAYFFYFLGALTRFHFKPAQILQCFVGCGGFLLSHKPAQKPTRLLPPPRSTNTSKIFRRAFPARLKSFGRALQSLARTVKRGSCLFCSPTPWSRRTIILQLFFLLHGGTPKLIKPS